MSPERLALRLAVDAAVRERVAAANEHGRLCSGCAMPVDDWTPGCSTCSDRHRRRLRSGYAGASPYLALRMPDWIYQLACQATRTGNQARWAA